MQDHPRLHAKSLATGATVPMREDQAHYLGQVMRRGQGDAVRLFNAKDGEWQASIETLPKRGQGSFKVAGRLRAPTPEHGPVLLFAPVKRDATDLIVRIATELGVRAIQPVLTARTNSARLNLERLQAIAIAAAEQCERLSLPDIEAPRSLAAVLSDWPAPLPLAVAIERFAPSGGDALQATPGGLLIGPEGGFTPLELDALRRHPFVTPISLGPRILRAETAAVAGLVCLQSLRERWGPDPQREPSSGGGQPARSPSAMPAEPDVEPR